MDSFRKMSKLSVGKSQGKSPKSRSKSRSVNSPRNEGERSSSSGSSPRRFSTVEEKKAKKETEKPSRKRSTMKQLPGALPVPSSSSSAAGSDGRRMEKKLLDNLAGLGAENIPNAAFLNQLSSIVPLLSSSHHETEASRPKLLLETLQMKAQALAEEVAAVRIQRIVRGHRGRRKTQKEMLLKNIKESLSISLTALLLDEILVGEVISLSNDLLGTEAKAHDLRQNMETNILRAVDSVMSEEVHVQVALLVRDCIREESTAYLDKKKNAVKNPLLRIILELCDEAVTESLPEVAQMAVSESVNLFLLERRGEKAFGYIAMEAFVDMFPSLIDESLAEADFQIANDTVLDEVIAEFARTDAEDFMKGSEKEKRVAVRHDDMRIIGTHLRRNMARRMLLGHLMMSIANNFEEVLLEHQCRCVVRRFIAHRLFKLVSTAGSAVAALKENRVTREIFSSLSAGPLQDMLLNTMVENSRTTLDEVDALEARLAGKWAREARNVG